MKKIIIVGAGISGMSAGIYGQLNGFATEIYEMHAIPGGECTGWDRGEYHFDGCIHYLMGTKPGTPLNGIWREVGALDDSVGIINTDCLYRYEEDGKAVNLYRDVDQLQKHLMEISPEDTGLITEMAQAIRALRAMELPIEKPMEMMTGTDLSQMSSKILPLMPYLQKYQGITIKDFAEQFKHPLLRRAFQFQIPSRYSAVALLSTLSAMNAGDAGWPAGGSREMAKRMERKYLSLGGKIHYGSKITRIKIRDGKATGIILADGGERPGDYIVSAADGHFTLQTMLEGKYQDEQLDQLYSNRETYPIYTTVQVSAGIAADLSREPDLVFFKPSVPVHAGGITQERIGLKHFGYDGSIAPQGKSVVTVLLDADYDWWQEKYRDRKGYKAEKARLAAEVCAAIAERFPETKGRIERTDVATPMTYVRYCNAWRGAWMSWMATPRGRINYLSGTVNGLENFWMSGQWTMLSGGLPGAVITGKWTIQRICCQLKQPFKTSM